jgi:Tol biopolymer transport system component
MNVDASNLTRLTTEREHAIDCSWSPDATKIAYAVVPWGLAGGHDLSRAEVYIMNADGSGKTKLTNTPEGSWGPGAGSWSSEWSPDGAKIAFTSNRGNRDGNFVIYPMDADGSDVTQVTNLPGHEQHPDWQPLTPKSRSLTVHPPDTGGSSLLLVASAPFFPGGSLLYAVVRRRM